MQIIIAILSLTVIIMTLIIFSLRRKINMLRNQFSGQFGNVSGQDLFENITKSKALYKDLLIEFHPDKFTTDEFLTSQAQHLTASIAENKSSYRELISIAKNAKQNFHFSDKFKSKYPEIFNQ
jgi:hypothetical protein